MIYFYSLFSLFRLESNEKRNRFIIMFYTDDCKLKLYDFLYHAELKHTFTQFS